VSVRLRRIQADYEEIKEGLRNHPAISVRGVSGSPPDRYQIEFKVRSLHETAEGDVTERIEHLAEIYLTLGYPRQAPQCRMLTPVFHPNIAPHAICIGDHWAAGESLLNLIVRIGEMLAYQSYNTKSPLNGAAARWVDENTGLVPTDPRDFSPSAWSDIQRSAAKEGECQNCRSSKGTITRCVNGHAVCADCLVVCESCQRSLCLPCKPRTCPVCGHVVCKECSGTCPQCGQVICKTHIETCSLCDNSGCPDCIIKCSKCGRQVCLDHVRQCAVCRQAVCVEHAIMCAICNKALCEEHVQRCSICGSVACPDCGFECSQCGARVCVNHVSQCAVCKQVLCTTHARICPQCGKAFCADHFDAASERCTECAGPGRPPDPAQWLVIECSSCGAKLRAPAAHAGKRAKCPTCGAVCMVGQQPPGD